MSSDKTTISVGIGLGGASFLVLLVLKVLDYIDMNWFWVLSSVLWVPVATFLAVMALVFGSIIIFYFILWVIDKIVDSWCSLHDQN